MTNVCSIQNGIKEQKINHRCFQELSLCSCLVYVQKFPSMNAQTIRRKVKDINNALHFHSTFQPRISQLCKHSHSQHAWEEGSIELYLFTGINALSAASAAFSRCSAFPRNQAVGGRLQHCSLCLVSTFSPQISLSFYLATLCAQLSRQPLELWGIFSLNRLIDIAGGRWTGTQTLFPGNQPENPQVDSHTMIPNPFSLSAA